MTELTTQRPTLHFDTTRYEAAFFERPRGTRLWRFQAADTVITYVGTYRAACAHIRAQAWQWGNNGDTVTVEVVP